MTRWNRSLGEALLLAACAMAPMAGHAQSWGDLDPPGWYDVDPVPGFSLTRLVADTAAGHALAVDARLVNPWGVAFFPNGAFWISDNATGVSTLYDGKGHVLPPTFVVPPPAGASGPSAPTGIVINETTGFLVPGTTQPAAFIFATEDGTISAWAGGLKSNPLDAVLAVDNSKAGAVYKGLEFGVTAAGAFLYATNFHSGAIDVFDTSFAPAAAKLAGKFADPRIPAGYAPFGIKNINGDLYVTYAKQNAAKHDDVSGAGHGFVDVFDTDGHLLQHFAEHGALNSPWGIALAPEGFGWIGNTILIGNFGDGRVNVFSPNGRPFGPLADRAGAPLVLPGLWALSFGGAAAAAPRTLYITAGGANETHGLFATITAP